MEPETDEDEDTSGESDDLNGPQPKKMKLPFRCDPCNQGFIFECLLKKHLETIKCKKKRRAAGEDIKIEGDYKCTKCGQAFAKRKTLKLHFKGDKCPKRTDPNVETDQTISEDKEMEKSTGEVKCSYCDFVASCKSNLTKHLGSSKCLQKRKAAGENVELKGNFKCPKCDQTYFQLSSLQRHLARNKCPNNIYSKGETHDQTEIKNREVDKQARRFKCIPCNKDFKDIKGYNQHLNSKDCMRKRQKAGEDVNTDGDYKCPACKKMFFRNRDLNKHLEFKNCIKARDRNEETDDETKDEDKERKFECIPCVRVFRFKGRLNKHLRTVACKAKRNAAGEDVVVEGDYKCPNCPRRFAGRNCLKIHLAGNKCLNVEDSNDESSDTTENEDVDGPFKCLPCQRVFWYEGYFNRHLKTPSCIKKRKIAEENENKSDYKSPRCSVTRSSSTELQLHLQDNKCLPKDDLNAETEAESENGDEEMLKVSGSYECKPCHVRVSYKGDLNKHLRTKECKRKRKAAGEDVVVEGDYRCPNCPRRFATNKNLKIHLAGNKCLNVKDSNDESSDTTENEDVDGPFRCLPCQRVFRYEGFFNRHLKTPSCIIKRKIAEENENKSDYNCPQKNDINAETKAESKNGDEKIHIVSGSYECKPCRVRVSYKGDLNKHLRTKECKRKRKAAGEDIKVEGDYKCTKCGITYVRRRALRIHLENNKCRKTEGSNDETKDESESDDEAKPFKCIPCDKSFKEYKYYNQHLKTNKCKYNRRKAGEDVKVEGNYKCPTCPRTFAGNNSLKKHLEGNKCPKTKDPNDETEDQTETIYEDGPFECIPCELVFSQKGLLNIHLKTMACLFKRKAAGENLIVKGEFKCPTCPNTYFCIRDLNIHLEDNQCPKTREAKDNTEDQSESDHEEKKLTEKYECKPCELVFNYKKNFENHRQTQDCKRKRKAAGEDVKIVGDYKCRSCPKTFAARKDLKLHKCPKTNDPRDETEDQTETIYEDGPFECSPCELVFTYKYKFNAHRQTQDCKRNRKAAGEDVKIQGPYKCRTCKETFVRSRYLKRHLKDSKCSNRTYPNGETDKTDSEDEDQRSKNSTTTVDRGKSLQVEDNVPEQNESDGNFHCEKCNFTCYWQSNFVRHMITHADHDDNPTTKANLNLQPTTKRIYPCRWCDVLFSSQLEVISDMEELHETNIPQDKVAKPPSFQLCGKSSYPYCCYICLETYPTLNGAYDCISLCERRIGLSMVGFVCPSIR